MSQSTKTLETSLLQLGFGPKEVRVYLGIQKHGKITPAQLAESTGINRATVYSIAKNLLTRGVITEDLAEKQRYLVASPPDSLAAVVRKEQKALNKKKDLVNDAMEQITKFAQNAEYAIPKIQFITEENIEDFLYRRAPDWNKSILSNDNSYLGFQEEAFVNQYADWIDWYWKHADPRIKLRLLSNDSHAEKNVAAKDYTQREIIFWKDNVKFTATTWVMGDYVVMFVLSSTPQYLVEIHDATFAQNQRALFKGILEDIENKQK